MITLLICDDQDIVREGLQVILETDPELRVVGTASDGVEALEAAARLHPDVVLMDLKMPHMNGIHATRELLARQPHTRVLVLTTYDGDEWVFDAIRSGAAGYVLKDTPRERLVAAVRDVAAGRTPVDPAVAGRLFSHVATTRPPAESGVFDALSERERAVLALLATGLANADIARRLSLSEGTVRNYVTAIFSKLDVTDRTQAALLAVRYGLA